MNSYSQCEHLNTTMTFDPYVVECNDCHNQWDEQSWTNYKEAKQAMYDHETEDAREMLEEMKALQDDYLEAEATGN